MEKRNLNDFVRNAKGASHVRGVAPLRTLANCHRKWRQNCCLPAIFELSSPANSVLCPSASDSVDIKQFYPHTHQPLKRTSQFVIPIRIWNIVIPSWSWKSIPFQENEKEIFTVRLPEMEKSPNTGCCNFSRIVACGQYYVRKKKYSWCTRKLCSQLLSQTFKRDQQSKHQWFIPKTRINFSLSK